MMRSSAKIYRWLLKLYPAGFREEYESPMERQFLDDYRGARNRLERAQVWLDAMADLAASVPAEICHEFILDMQHAARLYARRWITTLLTVTALGLAIGMSTGVFSVLNALLLRGLPFSKPTQLMELYRSPFNAFSGRAAFNKWTQSNSYLQSAATYSSSDMNLAQGHEGYRVKVAETSANFFGVLGVKPELGRTFSAEEDIPGNNAITVISFDLWQQLFGGRGDVKGLVLHVNGAAFTIVGVMPARFDYPAKTNMWLPTVYDFEKIPKRGAFLLQTIGRLKDSVNIRRASALYEAEVRSADPHSFALAMIGGEQTRPKLASLRDQLAGPVGQASWVLAGLTLLVLLAACANVAQMLLSRTMDRREELELRAALGASRGRLLQQLITEALLLTLSGAALGLIVAEWTAKLSSSFAPAQLFTQQYTIVDWPVLTFATAVAVTMGVMFGVTPVWLLASFHPSGRIGPARSGATHVTTKRVRMALVALQIATALCLVSGSFSMGRTFLGLLHADLGFRPEKVVTLNVSLQGTRNSGAGEWGYYLEALDRLRAVPGVSAAGAVSYLPLASNIYMANSFALDSGQKVERVVTNAATPAYFRAIGTKFLAGADFLENTGKQSQAVVIVNETFARDTGLGQRIIGRKVIAPWSGKSYEVVGVVGTARLSSPADPGGPQIYWRIEEEPPGALTLVARVQGRPENFLAQCRDAVRRADPTVPVYDVETLDKRLSDTLSRPRFYTTAIVFLGLLAVLLATISSYGTVAYSIAQRRHELGIRMAVGASCGRIRVMVLREAGAPILLGILGGLVFTLLASRYLEHLLENASQPSLWACAASAAGLMLTGIVATWIASERILRIDPSEALRAE